MANDGALRRQGSHSHRRGVVDAVPPSDLPVFALASKISAGDMDRGDTGGKTVTSGMAEKLESFLSATLPEIGRSEVSAAYVAQTLENTGP